MFVGVCIFYTISCECCLCGCLHYSCTHCLLIVSYTCIKGKVGGFFPGESTFLGKKKERLRFWGTLQHGLSVLWFMEKCLVVLFFLFEIHGLTFIPNGASYGEMFSKSGQHYLQKEKKNQLILLFIKPIIKYNWNHLNVMWICVLYGDQVWSMKSCIVCEELTCNHNV